MVMILKFLNVTLRNDITVMQQGEDEDLQHGLRLKGKTWTHYILRLCSFISHETTQHNLY